MALGCADRGGADDDPIHPSLNHCLDDVFLHLFILAGGSHEQAVAVSLGDFLDPLQDFTEEGVVNIADDDTQGTRAVGFQRAGGGAGQVAQVGSHLADTVGGFFRNEPAAVECPRHGGVGDLSLPGNILDGDGCDRIYPVGNGAHVCTVWIV